MARKKKPEAETPASVTPEAPATLDTPVAVQTLSDAETQALVEAGAIDPELLSVALAAELTKVEPLSLPTVPTLKTPPQVGSLPALRHKARTHGELFDTVSSANPADRVDILRANDSAPLRWLLQLVLNGKDIWVLPEGIPPFKVYKGRPFSAPTDLRREQRRLYIYLQHGNENVTAMQREKLFRNLLESLDETEVSVLAHIKEGRAGAWGITSDLITAAFPGLAEQPFDVKFGR